MPQADEAQMAVENKADEEGLRDSAQKQPLAQSQNAYSPLSQNLYPINGASNIQYGTPQRIAPRQNYAPQPYRPYSYGNNPINQQVAWNSPAPVEPLLGNKFWEYPNIKARRNNLWRPAPKPQPVVSPWYQPAPQNYYYGRRPVQQYLQQNPFSSPLKPAAPQNDPFDPTSEAYYQAEYSYGSVRPPNKGIELIPTEVEKGKDGRATGLSRVRAWHNYHTGKPLWALQNPIIKRPPQPVNIFNPRPNYVPNPRPDYVPNPRPDYVPNPRPDYVPNPRPDYIPDQSKQLCYMNCRRRCGWNAPSKCAWNSGCGGGGGGCRGARVQRYNGQYWGAAAPWNNVQGSKGQPAVSKNPTVPSEGDSEEQPEKPCEWKWIEKQWKWVCKDESQPDGSGDQEDTVIEA